MHWDWIWCFLRHKLAMLRTGSRNLLWEKAHWQCMLIHHRDCHGSSDSSGPTTVLHQWSLLAVCFHDFPKPIKQSLFSFNYRTSAGIITTDNHVHTRGGRHYKIIFLHASYNKGNAISRCMCIFKAGEMVLQRLDKRLDNTQTTRIWCYIIAAS